MKILFIIISIAGLAYFILKKRTFDLFSLAYISAMVYFLPGFLGYVIHPSGFRQLIIDKTYIVMIICIISILIGGLINDVIVKRDNTKIYKIKGSDYILNITNILSFISFILVLITIGDALFSTSKSEMMSQSNRWEIIWLNLTAIGAVIVFTNKSSLFIKIYYASMVGFNIYMGDRTIPAIIIISIVYYHINKKGKQIFISNYKEIIIGLLFALVFFVYKKVYVVIKAGRFDILLERLSDINFYINSIAESEPFTTQAILNSIISNDFMVGMEHLKYILYQFVPFASEFGGNIITFNSLFQPQLFAGTKFGMGSNIWAQMYSTGGFGVLIIFNILFVVSIFIFNYIYNKMHDSIKSPFILISVFSVFYIHRNSLDYQIKLEMRILIIWIFILLSSIILREIYIKISSKYNKNTNT